MRMLVKMNENIYWNKCFLIPECSCFGKTCQEIQSKHRYVNPVFIHVSERLAKDTWSTVAAECSNH